MSLSNNGYLTTHTCLLQLSDNEYNNNGNNSYAIMEDYNS